MSKALNLTKDEFISVCDSSNSLQEASQKLNIHYNTFRRYIEKFNYCPKFCNKNPGKKYLIEDIFSGKYPFYPTSKLHKRLLKEGFKEHKCEKCGNSEWNGRPIPLELHHKDGIRTNHSLSNLMLLCPNCHAQTDNFKAKNITHINILEE